VATLHNFRPLCAAGTLLRDGRRCTACSTDPWAGLRHACFQASRAATLPLAVAGRRGPAAHPVIRRADRLIAISSRAVDEYAAAGVTRDRFIVVPNAVLDVPGPAAHSAAGARWLFLGRLSAEKGVRELLDLWPVSAALDVIGDGELLQELRGRRLPPTVRLLGGRTNSQVRALLGDYTGLVVPSMWAEAGPPLTYVEALAAGVPTVAWAGNGAADDVALHDTGMVVGRPPTTAELAAALDQVRRDRARLATRCRAEFEARFSTSAWVDALLTVYADVRRVRDMGEAS
jgi:glycosyltransferase involved in cell wall biosynthesis